MSQRLRIIQHKNPYQAKGLWISRKSIGTINVGGRTYTYNADKIYTNQIDVDKIVEDNSKKRKIIIVRKRK